MQLVPADDRIIALQSKPEEKTASGFLLAEAARVKPPTCKVTAVGKDVSRYKVGDVLLFTESYGKDSTVQTMKIDKDEYVFLKESDVLAKVEG